MIKKHEADILAEQIKKGKFNGKILKLRINKNSRIESAIEESVINFKENAKKIAK